MLICIFQSFQTDKFSWKTHLTLRAVQQNISAQLLACQMLAFQGSQWHELSSTHLCKGNKSKSLFTLLILFCLEWSQSLFFTSYICLIKVTTSPCKPCLTVRSKLFFFYFCFKVNSVVTFFQLFTFKQVSYLFQEEPKGFTMNILKYISALPVTISSFPPGEILLDHNKGFLNCPEEPAGSAIHHYASEMFLLPCLNPSP